MARPGEFRFATVMRVRKRQEQLRAQSLGEVRKQIQSTVNERDRIAQEQVQTIEDAADTTREEFRGPQVHNYFQYERHLSRLAVEKDATLRHLRKIEAERQAALEEATKRRKMIERLHDRYLQADAVERRKMEQKLNDEIAGIRATMDSRPEHDQ